jgi:hypothetical protein
MKTCGVLKSSSPNVKTGFFAFTFRFVSSFTSRSMPFSADSPASSLIKKALVQCQRG